ncbi:hypothetical protein A3D00_01645 [Candidatus Woesebacteria bacterium RIFCSPHIGHO2_02_FULL_38_9]|uniref:PIN domain-containing protein n=1 Tax=Candidatus Woesebacteria bacterium RIFCSPHIGHO2_01_FULL_39_28 TaxID=1802496 RepID=A0A1F7YKT1_9BACT|nr:MAG: hypothetical protein A2627_02020 [Candidatus Woesebacteria bacterium RIFCSPHIGHO2_01_FULL_39_28]OGM34090.1 MAG: hypothetical protein A3D00_01645 [Candidatus Woesebacteria bacterium RIFCSPHIGHO2_02_FULL_38_9]OGM56779.1 MAG: hypothetical protein A3A50_04215 [Candidatus Woesebacteria bacterium RIFCSPLOWO2_01_FULL_38_20]
MFKKIVVDSSVILKWLYREDEKFLKQADFLLQQALDGKVALLAPELAKYEVGNVLLRAKQLYEDQGRETLSVFYSIPIHFVTESFELSKQAFGIGVKSGITYYDAAFVALTKQERATLITDNPKHQTRIPGIKVVPLREYKETKF